MKKQFGLVALVAALAATPALAGNASMKNAEGAKLRIKCENSGCKVRQKLPGGKWAVIEKTAGGRDNFLVLEAKYKKAGYK